jgi:hypothetical protein
MVPPEKGGEYMAARRWLGTIVAVSFASGVAAQDADCANGLDDDEVEGNLNIAVPCTLAGTEVSGNVTIYAGGSLTARDARIRGNLEARRANFVDLSGSRVDGNIRLEELVGDRTTLDDSDIRGNVSLIDNRSLLEVFDNEIDGNLRLVGNVGGVVISGNEIDGSLECSGNRPAPVGGRNRFERRATGQCANLQSATAPPDPAPAPSSPPVTVTPGGGAPAATPPPVTEQPPVTATPEVVAARPDLTPPTLTLRGSSTVNVLIDSAYTDEGAVAIDDVDGDLTPRIVATSNVDTKKLGIYTVTYAVSDRAGNAARAVSRTVNVTPEATAQEGPGGGGALLVELALLVMVWSQRGRCPTGGLARLLQSLRRVDVRCRQSAGLRRDGSALSLQFIEIEQAVRRGTDRLEEPAC